MALTSTAETTTFNHTEQVAEGWYWALRSGSLTKGAVAPVKLLGRDLVAWRGQDGVVRVADAFCPHMGAHLAEGRGDGTGIRCFFHDWRFAADGACDLVPCQDKPANVRIRTWPVAERYGLVWVYTGAEPRFPVPFAPELEHDPCDARLSSAFEKACHPNVVMINAIDAQHFNSVHNLPVKLFMERRDLSAHAASFSNTTGPSADTLFGRFLKRFYAGPITYSMCYWAGTNGTVTLGPDFWHFHILFALRLGEGGKTEGQTVLLTRRRTGPAKLLSWIALFLSDLVGRYFAMGDTRVFQTIRFDFQTPVKSDHAIVGFIKHFEAQPAVRWGSWEPVAPGLSLAASAP